MTTTDDALAVARAVDRVAVLVAAGVPPPRALALVAELGAGAGAGTGPRRASSVGRQPSTGGSEVDGVLAVAARTG